MTCAFARIPVSLELANTFVGMYHRHHFPVVGHKFSIGALAGEELVGVVIVGRPVSRHRDDGLTLEVTRLCTDGTKNACSFLYGAAARAAFALGYARIGTYIRKDEPGVSLTAAGWRLIGETPGRSWSVPSRSPSAARATKSRRPISKPSCGCRGLDCCNPRSRGSSESARRRSLASKLGSASLILDAERGLAILFLGRERDL